ncbi:unnamed protein product [Acanthoscelides obtectus]|uniref:Uncharacterized protein n=1 Tax=Acanthoscelides obtectus TaxID=200917 RepID=A0A9P0KWV1_ACAOB|nr:unnamed protein product [Acanthoscelides obtectus]CAK1666392.1 hypothetical protein AOBTE_LOCUS25298 [Acanthoscelides obtectus]
MPISFLKKPHVQSCFHFWMFSFLECLSLAWPAVSS